MADPLNVCAGCLTTFREGDSHCTKCGREVQPHTSLHSLLTTADEIKAKEGQPSSSQKMFASLPRQNTIRPVKDCQISGYDPSVAEDAPPDLFIVGHCPKCGAPIYGKPSVVKTEVPSVKYTCHCRANDNRVMRHS